MITHGMKLGGAALLGFTLFACGTSGNITQGTVIGVRYDPAHPKTKRVCKVRVKSTCMKYETKSDGWDDADYELKISDGKNTSWVEVDNSAIFAACPVNVKYPACENLVS